MTSRTQSPRETGQALLGGLCLFFFTAAGILLFFWVSERSQAASEDLDKARRLALAERMQSAHLLNQIALNNRAILAALGQSLNALREASAIGLGVALSTPYWQTHAFSNRTSSSEGDPLDLIFRAFSRRSARGLRIAGGLTRANKILIADLETLNSGMRGLFEVSSAAQAACAALHLSFPLKPHEKAHEKPPKKPYEPRPAASTSLITATLGVLPDLYLQGCSVHGSPPQSGLTSLNGRLGDDAIFDAHALFDFSQGADRTAIGLTFVDSMAQAKVRTFVKALAGEQRSPAKERALEKVLALPASRPWVAQASLVHPCLKMIQVPSSTSSTYSSSWPTLMHSESPDREKCAIGTNGQISKLTLLTQADFAQPALTLDPQAFLLSFFSSQWSAIIVSETLEEKRQ